MQSEILISHALFQFQTVLKADDKEGLHFGYWRDNPKSLPVFVGKNSASKDCKITPEAPNIFAAVKYKSL